MIDIDALKPGDVVQLVSGSPVMTVRGFWGATRPAKRPGQPMEMTRQKVICVVWVQRVGIEEYTLAPHELRLPRPRAEATPAEAGVDDEPRVGEDDLAPSAAEVSDVAREVLEEIRRGIRPPGRRLRL